MITIIGILIALLLPAVQAAREAARRMQCSSNIRQWGLGMHQYHSTFNCFPMASISDGGSGTSGEDRKTFVVLLWPYIEQKNLWDLYDQSKPFYVAANRKAVNTPVAIYYCPSDRPGALWTANNARIVRGNYVVNFGTNMYRWLPTNAKYIPAPFGDFIKGVGTLNRAADIKDGLSNTIFMSEIAIPAANDDDDIRGCIVNNTAGGASFMTIDTPNAGVDSCVCPGNPSYPGPCLSKLGGNGTNSARSQHANGVMALLGDGSATFVGDNIAINIWRAYGTIRGNEPFNGAL